MNNTIYIVEGSYGEYDTYTTYIVGWFKSEADANARVEALEKVLSTYRDMNIAAWKKLKSVPQGSPREAYENAENEYYKDGEVQNKNFHETLASLGDTTMMEENETPNGWEVIPVSELV